jgi:hypothetical protein
MATLCQQCWTDDVVLEILKDTSYPFLNPMKKFFLPDWEVDDQTAIRNYLEACNYLYLVVVKT